MSGERTTRAAKIRELLDQATVKPIDDLLKRAEWGSIDFSAGRPDFERAFALLEPLKTLPLDVLPANALNQINEGVQRITNTIQAIDKFSLNVGSPASERDQALANLKNEADHLFNQVASFIPYLAYHRGDIQRQLAHIDAAVKQANETLSGAVRTLTEKKTELDGILTEARNAAASAGAAVFVQDFESEAEKLNKSACYWLIATSGLAGIGLLTAVASFVWLMPQPDANVTYIVQYTVAKVFSLGVLIAAALWSGSIYRAIKHQATTNRHRANGLKTFQAFLKAASDDLTRNAVLLETTRSIFAVTPTGYLSATETNTDSGLKATDALKLAKTQ